MDGTEGEASRFTYVVHKLLFRLPPHTSQDHAIVRAVSWVLDSHVLEQSVICSEDIIRLGPDLSTIPPHAPCAPILQPRFTPWEDVQARVLYPRRCELVCDGFNPCCAFWIREISIEFVGYQDLGPVRLIHDGRSDVLYVWGVSGVDIASHDMPLPPPHYQLKSDDVPSIKLLVHPVLVMACVYWV